MNPKIVLDSSIIIKWFRSNGEEKVVEARNYLQRIIAGEIVILVPDLLYYEIANIAKNDKTQSQDFWQDSLETLFSSSLEVLPPDNSFIKKAYKLAKDLNISVYDACYLVLARDNGSFLVTADKELLAKAPGLTKSL